MTPTYDANGNLLFDGTNTLGYDAENRLTSASAAGMTASYAFDGRGRRKSKTVNGTTTVFVTDADNREVLEYDGASGAIQRWYAYGLGPNDVLNRMEVGAATRTTFVPDLLGSVVATLASASGTLSKIGYLPYGSGSVSAPFGFTGQRVDSESGLYYYRARHYSAALGRFLQTDPSGYDAGPHLYLYALNDPLNRIDLFGLTDSLASTSTLQLALQGAYGIFVAGMSGAPADIAANPGRYAVAGVGAVGLIAGAAGAVTYATTSTVAGLLSAPAIGTEAAWVGQIAAGAVPEGGMTAYRVWGGASSQAGSWLSPIAPSSSSAARSLLALPSQNTAQFVSTVQIPAGTQIQFGLAARAFSQPGGGMQIQLLQRIPTASFGPGVPLPP